MKKSFNILIFILALLLVGCSSNGQGLLISRKSNVSVPMEKFLPNHYNFTENILDGDLYEYNKENRTTYLVSKNGAKELKGIVIDEAYIEDSKLYGQKYYGYEGNESWMNPIIEYDINSDEFVEIFKANKEFENARLLCSDKNKLLLNIYDSKDDRWSLGKGRVIEYDIKNKSSREISFQFNKDYENTSIICADFCGNGYVVSFAFMDSRKSGADGAGTRVVLTDEEGKTIKYLKLTAAEDETASVYRTLSASKDGSKILYSHGSSAIDVYMYDIKTEKTILIADKNAFQPRWSKKYNSIYYLTMELNKGVYNIYLHRYDVR